MAENAKASCIPSALAAKLRILEKRLEKLARVVDQQIKCGDSQVTFWDNQNTINSKLSEALVALCAQKGNSVQTPISKATDGIAKAKRKRKRKKTSQNMITDPISEPNITTITSPFLIDDDSLCFDLKAEDVVADSIKEKSQDKKYQANDVSVSSPGCGAPSGGEQSHSFMQAVVDRRLERKAEDVVADGFSGNTQEEEGQTNDVSVSSSGCSAPSGGEQSQSFKQAMADGASLYLFDYEALEAYESCVCYRQAECFDIFTSSDKEEDGDEQEEVVESGYNTDDCVD